MIQRLRQRHHNLFAILTVALPLLFLAGLASRPPTPRMKEIPPFLLNTTPILFRVLLERNNLWPGFDILTRVCADQIPPQRLIVELQPHGNIAKPDVLVYWQDSTAAPEKRLPENVFLLGALAGKQLRRFDLPPAALQSEGRLILYSLAHQQIVAATTLPTLSLLSSRSPK